MAALRLIAFSLCIGTVAENVIDYNLSGRATPWKTIEGEYKVKKVRRILL